MRASIVLTLALVASAARPASAARYTLEALVRKVATEHPGAVAAREALEATQAQLAQQRRLWTPTGDATLTATGAPDVRCRRTLDPTRAADGFIDCYSTNITDIRGGIEPTSLGQRAPFDNLLLGLTVSLIQPLYTFGKIEAAIGLGKAGVAQGVGNARRDRAELLLLAARAYWGLKLARAAVAILSETLALLEGWQEAIDTQLSGVNRARYSESDLIRMKIGNLFTRQQLLDYQRWQKSHLATLRGLTNDPEADIDDAELAACVAEAGTVEEWQDRARRHRPELPLIEASLGAARGWKRLRLTEMLPDIGVVTYLGYGYNSFPQPLPPNGYIPQPAGALYGGLYFAVRNRLDLGVALGRYAATRAEERAARLRIEQAIGGISIEIQKAWLDYREARARARQAAFGEKTARGWLVAVDTNLSLGIFTNGLEMIEVLRSWLDFRLRHVSALVDTYITWAALRRATDLDSDDPTALAAALTGRP